MRNSFELTKENPPKYWFMPIIWGVILFYGIQTIGGIPLFLGFKYWMPGALGEIYVALFSFAFSILATILLTKYLNKRPVESLGFHKEGFVKNYIVGLLIGGLLIAFTIVASFLFGTITIEFNSMVNWGAIFVLLLGFMIQGMAEEVVCRGYVQNALRLRWGLVVTMIIQAAFFSALHSMNDGMTVMPVINLFLYGAFVGILFYYTDNLWMAGGIHSVWNFLLGPILGIEVSGHVIPGTVFMSSFTGSELLTGGSFGMEGSIFTTIGMCVGIIIVYLMYNKKKKAEYA